MNDHGKYPGGRGHSWRGDWHRRMIEILAERGFANLTAFARTRPNATLGALAAEIGVGDVAPIQVQWVLFEEAKSSGALRPFATDLLARRLHEVDAGWPAGTTYGEQKAVRHQLVAWQGCLRDEAEEAKLAQVTRALLDATDIPAGWKPSGPDDPVIMAVFERYWPGDGKDLP